MATVSARFSAVVFSIFLLSAAAPAIEAAQAYIIVDAKSGHIFQERNSRQKRQVGSLTKIATAMVVLDWAEKENADLNQMVRVPPEAFVGTGENLIGLQPGDTLSLRDLLYAALVQSDNVSAFTLAAHVGAQIQTLAPGNIGPVGAFVAQMNALAKALKMERTLFVNPTGQDATKPLPYSTAADIARLSRYALGKAGFRFYVSQKERQISFTREGKAQSYVLKNTNELLGGNGVDGVKTGRTARAGDCLVLSAQREADVIKHSETSATVIPRQLIIVLLGSPNRFGEGEQLLNTAWQLQEQWEVAGRMVNPRKVL